LLLKCLCPAVLHASVVLLMTCLCPAVLYASVVMLMNKHCCRFKQSQCRAVKTFGGASNIRAS
jgi:hypothetical protein